MVLITYFFHESEQTYGYRRIHADLVDQGRPASAQTWRSRLHATGRPGSLPASEAGSVPPPRAKDLVQRPDLVKRDFTANKPGQKRGGRYQLYFHMGRIHLSSDCDGLPLEENHRLCDCREYAHLACCRGFTHGSQKLPSNLRRNRLPFRSWFAIHLS